MISDVPVVCARETNKQISSSEAERHLHGIRSPAADHLPQETRRSSTKLYVHHQRQGGEEVPVHVLLNQHLSASCTRRPLNSPANTDDLGSKLSVDTFIRDVGFGVLEGTYMKRGPSNAHSRFASSSGDFLFKHWVLASVRWLTNYRE